VGPIYLDHHATTPVDPRVLAAMLPVFTKTYGNPSSRVHVFGEEAARAVGEAREQVADLLGASPDEIVFTSGATESNTLALEGSLAREGRGHVVTSALEHSSVLEPLKRLAKRGLDVTVLPSTPEGLVSVAQVRDALRPDTRLVSLMAANNEVGTLQPVGEVAALCRERGILFHTDAVQALGKVELPLAEADLASLSAHKMYGPKGVGALFVRASRRPRIRLEPVLLGGGQEGGVRSGTLNVPGIVGFGVAASLAREALASGEPGRLLALRDRLLAGLRRELEGVHVNGALSPRLPGNLHVSIDRAEAETLLLSLGGRIAISSGAACAEAGGKGSHVLRALGLPDERVYTALRFGLGRYNTEAEIDSCVAELASAVRTSRERSASAMP
jgi:cysteine desulfurase